MRDGRESRRSGDRGPIAALLLTLAVGMVLAGGLVALAGEVYDEVVDRGGVAGIDQVALDWSLAHRTPALEQWVTRYTDVAGTTVMPVLAGLVTVLFAIVWRSWTPAVLMIAATAGSLLMTVVGKRLFDRARPPLADAVPPYEHSPSFPSGHTLNATVIAGVVAYLLVRRQTRRVLRVCTIVIAAGFAITIGLSRIYLGHHWFTDVLAGWLIGAGWVAFVITAHRVFLLLRRGRDTDQGSSANTVASGAPETRQGGGATG